MCLVEELLSEFPSFQRVGLVRDVVSLEDAPGLVTGDLHDHGLGLLLRAAGFDPPSAGDREQESGDTGGLAT